MYCSISTDQPVEIVKRDALFYPSYSLLGHADGHSIVAVEANSYSTFFKLCYLCSFIIADLISFIYKSRDYYFYIHKYTLISIVNKVFR